MSIHFKGGYLYGCYSTGTVGFKRHYRAIAGDFCSTAELHGNVLDAVGLNVGKIGGDGGVRSVQLPFDKNGKEAT